MQDTYFKMIEQLHSEWSLMNKTTRIVYLKRQWDMLNQMAFSYAQYLQNRTPITTKEREYAHHLIEMINSIEAEGMKSQCELGDEWMKELMKADISH